MENFLNVSTVCNTDSMAQGTSTPVHTLYLAGFKYENFANSRFCKKSKMAEKSCLEMISKRMMWKWDIPFLLLLVFDISL